MTHYSQEIKRQNSYVGEQSGEEHVLQRWLSKEQIAKDILQ